MRPYYTSSSVPSSPITINTFHCLQPNSSSFQPKYFQSSSPQYDLSKQKPSEQYNSITYNRNHLYQNVNHTNSSSGQHFSSPSSHHFSSYSQSSNIQSSTPNHPYEYYRNTFTHSQPNIANDSSYTVHETRIGSTQSNMSENNGIAHYSSRSAVMNTQSQIPQSQFRDSNMNQTSKRPRPPPPPPRSGSWTSGKTIAVTSTTVDDCTTNQHWLGKYARESPSPSPSPSVSSASSLASGAQMKMTTCSSDSTTAGNVNYSTQQQQQQQQQHSCIAHQMHNPTIGYTNSNTPYTPLMNGYPQANQHLNYHIPNHESGGASRLNDYSSSTTTNIPVGKQPITQRQSQHPYQQPQYQQHQTGGIPVYGQLSTTTPSSQYQFSNITPSGYRSNQLINHNSNNSNNNNSYEYQSKQLIVNSRKDVIEALLSLLIWHHPEANFTENMNQSEIQAFHAFLSNWLAKSDTNWLANNNNTIQQYIPNVSQSPQLTNTHVAQCTRQILTHLIRILYSDTAYEEVDSSINQTGKEIDEEEYNMNGTENDENHSDNNNNNNKSNHFVSYSSSSTNGIVSRSRVGGGGNDDDDGYDKSSVSVYSCDEETRITNDANNRLQQQQQKSSDYCYYYYYSNTTMNNSTHSNTNNDINLGRITLADSKNLFPPNTSLMELKVAAMEAIHKLAPLCQPEPKLYGRDMSIIQLLTAIHSYSLSLSERISQTNTNTNSNTQVMNSNDDSNSGNENIVNSLTTNNLDKRTNNLSSIIESCAACPVAEVAALVRLSFDAMHRNAICELGGVHALISLLRIEQTIWSEYLNPFSSNNNNNTPPISATTTITTTNTNTGVNTTNSLIIGNQNVTTTLLENSLALRRYICMALTNLTYATIDNKAFICRRIANLEVLLAQLETGNEELKQVSASVLRNLSWRTDSRSKAALRRVCAAKRLTIAAMSAQKESTLRTTLSALWNLSAHCSQNKKAVCSVDGLLPFLLRMLRLQNPVENLVIIENSGGILRNISTIIASRDDYRSILHQYNCFPILLELLRNPPSLTVVVNVCGTLWNLTCSSLNNIIPNAGNNGSNNNTSATSTTTTTSAANTTNIVVSSHHDRLLLLQLGALELIQKLTQSKHDLIRNSSMAVYRNLLQTDTSMNQNYLPSSSSSHNYNQNYTDTTANTATTTNYQVSVLNVFTSTPQNSTNNHQQTYDGGSSNNNEQNNSSYPPETSSLASVSQTTTPTSSGEQSSYKRRVSSRSCRLRFGLLSVVFEAESDDEIDDVDDEDDVDDDNDDVTEEDEVVEHDDVSENGGENHHHHRQEREQVEYEADESFPHPPHHHHHYEGELSMNRDHFSCHDNKNSESLCDAEIMISESTDHFPAPPPHHHHHAHDHEHVSNWCDHPVSHVNDTAQLMTDEEQTRVYAEEGTPFPPDSTTASSLELNRTDEKIVLNDKCDKVYNTSNETQIIYSNNNNNNHESNNYNLPLTMYRNDPVPHVYAMEGTPSNCDSHLSREDSIHNSESRLNEMDFISYTGTNTTTTTAATAIPTTTTATHCEAVHTIDDNTYLPSPPADISNLVSPLTSLNLEDCDKYAGCQFPMPPPPPPPSQPLSIFPIACRESDAEVVFSSKQTPLVFSRGTSSCLSSLDLEIPFPGGGFQSSPDSEYSNQLRSNDLSSDVSGHFSGGISSNSSNSSASACDRNGGSRNHNRNCNVEIYANDSCCVEGEEDEGDVRLPFAEEGTPQDAVSLNGGGGNTNPMYLHSHTLNQSEMKSNIDGMMMNRTICEVGDGVDVDIEDDDDEDDDDDDDDEDGNNQHSEILQQCIASAMPSNNAFSVLLNHSPTTTNNNNNNKNFSNPSDILFNETDDSLKTFAVENTPFSNSTKASSLSDLIISEHKGLVQQEEEDEEEGENNIGNDSNAHLPHHASLSTTENINLNHGGNSSSTSSSLNGDNSSDLLSEVIQSAMPKCAGGGGGGVGQLRLSNLCSMIQATDADTAAAVADDEEDDNEVDGDCLQMYALEGTPGGLNDNLSYSSSLPNDEGGSMISETSNSLLSMIPKSSCLFQPLNNNNNQPPPTPPLRTTSALTTTSCSNSSSPDPFAKVSDLMRPRATVAPMLQTKCHSLNSPIVSRSQNMSEQSSKSYLHHTEIERNDDDVDDCILMPNSSLPSSSSPSHYTGGGEGGGAGGGTVGGDKDDASSFSSLLSIESVGMEHSLLQECISSAMPRPKSISLLRKQQHQQPHQFSQQQQQKQPSSSSPQQHQQQQHQQGVQLMEEKSSHQPIDSADNHMVNSPTLSLSNLQVYKPSQPPVSKKSSQTQAKTQQQTSRIPSHNANKTYTKSNNSLQATDNSSSSTMHFLDHGSDDVQPPLCQNTNSPMTMMMMKKHTLKTSSTVATIPTANPAASTISTTATTATFTVNYGDKNNSHKSNNTNNHLPQVLNQVSCASFGARIPKPSTNVTFNTVKSSSQSPTDSKKSPQSITEKTINEILPNLSKLTTS
ncbi:unnamed protein product [Trichobilharzia szidati]|nr:unnamed protein product [Trichobilharzia szidati]